MQKAKEMSKVSNKVKQAITEEVVMPDQVKLIKSVLGVPEGTVLTYDKVTGRYVYNVVAEDMSADGYEYNSNLLDMDPSIVLDNMGYYFEVFGAEVEGTEEVSETPEPEKTDTGEKVKDDKPSPQKVGDEVEGPTIEGDEADLVVTCGVCGHETMVGHLTSDFIVSLPINNYAAVDLKCEECGAQLTLHYKSITEKDKDNESTDKGNA